MTPRANVLLRPTFFQVVFLFSWVDHVVYEGLIAFKGFLRTFKHSLKPCFHKSSQIYRATYNENESNGELAIARQVLVVQA